MQSILLVDDDTDVFRLVDGGLSTEFNLIHASNVQDAEAALSRRQFDLIILDVNLPDGDGFRFCTGLKESSQTSATPIFFLSSNKATPDKVLGFNAGAEDYIVKPFDVIELRARIKARLKTRVRSSQIQLGKLAMNLDTHRVEMNAQDLCFTPIEFKLLLHFTKNKDRLQSRNQIIDAVWGNDVNVIDRTVDHHVSQIRKKIHGSGNNIIAVSGEGYYLASKSDEPSN